MEGKISHDVREYKDKIKKARDIVEELKLEEPYKTNAFNAILKELLEKNKSPQTSQKNKKNALTSEGAEGAQFNFEEIPYFDNFDKSNWKDKLLNLLQWAKQNHSEKGLVTSEFVNIFKERFRMPYIDSGKN